MSKRTLGHAAKPTCIFVRSYARLLKLPGCLLPRVSGRQSQKLLVARWSRRGVIQPASVRRRTDIGEQSRARQPIDPPCEGHSPKEESSSSIQQLPSDCESGYPYWQIPTNNSQSGFSTENGHVHQAWRSECYLCPLEHELHQRRPTFNV